MQSLGYLGIRSIVYLYLAMLGLGLLNDILREYLFVAFIDAVIISAFLYLIFRGSTQTWLAKCHEARLKMS